MEELIVLVHSPLVGPFTWSLVAKPLQAIGFEVVVPPLSDSGEEPPPYWQQHAACVQRALASIPHHHSLLLIGHSGAGSLLPILAQVARHPVSGYLFVDAGLPHPGQSRLDEMEASVLAFAHVLRQHLAAGGRFPTWSEEDLREGLPDGATRRRLLVEVQPRPLSFFEGSLPLVDIQPGTPCGYLLLTQVYRRFLQRAQQAGWPNQTLHGGHFHLVVDPFAVATALLELMKQMKK